MSTYRIINADCLVAMKQREESSVDSIVTDPPYGLKFMGKEWDHGVPGKEFWVEALRVLKPGGHLLAFSGTRTYHRLATAIEDAGFEIRDQLQWLYGCLDEQTECLTRTGWKRYTELTTNDEVQQWNSQTGALSWVRPSEIIIKPYSGKMVRLKNRHTDQMLTPNHRVYGWVRKHARNPEPQVCEVYQAGDLKPHWRVDLPMAGRLEGNINIDPEYAYIMGWWLTDAWVPGDSNGNAVHFSQSKPKTLEKLLNALQKYNPRVYTKEPKAWNHNIEHTLRVTGELAQRLLKENLLRKITPEMLDWSFEARQALFAGLVDGDGSVKEGQYGHAFWSQNSERRGLFTALCLGLGMRAYEDIENGCVYFNTNSYSTQIQYKHATDPEQYEGDVWCVRVPDQAFVVRRNGRPFITGNSGFPKSLNVEKVMDKYLKTGNSSWNGTGDSSNGALGYSKLQNDQGYRPKNYGGRHNNKSAITKEEAKQWQGWGTALKPAHEPIVLARKPLAGTVAQNVLEHGTGALNIDGCRIDYNGETPNLGGRAKHTRGEGYGFKAQGDEAEANTLGRWPANILFDEKAAAVLDQQSGLIKSGGKKKTDKANSNGMFGYGGAPTNETDPSAGGASRFFYTSKASKAEQDAGLENVSVFKSQSINGQLCKDELTELVALLQKATSELAIKWSIDESGKRIMGLCQKECLSTTLTKISKITISQISNLLTPSHTSVFTLVAAS